LTDDLSEKWSLRGCELLRLGDLDGAENAFDESLIHHKECILAWAGKQKIALSRGRDQEVEEIQNQIDQLIMEVDSKPMSPHDPLELFFPELLKRYYPEYNLRDYLNIRISAVNDLIDHFSSKDKTNILKGYSENEIQEAYVIRYYSHYVEPIYRELSILPIWPWVNKQSDHLSVCYYGCGPAPEFLGVTRFICERMPEKRIINSYFFEKNPWDWAREITTGYCVNRYKAGSEVKMKQWNYQIDLTTFVDENKILQYPAISAARLHIFQNCLRDLQMDCHEEDQVMDVLLNIFHSIPEGSTMVVVDLKYQKTRDLLREFADRVKDDMNGLVIRSRINDTERTHSNLIKCPELASFERQIGRDRLGTNYYSMAIERI
jgi:hypothetical protein